MEIRPILSTLRRHKTAAALIIVEIAISCAIICNALFLISHRLDRMHMPSGVAEDQLIYIQAASMPQINGNSESDGPIVRGFIDTLKQVPGVTEVSVTRQIPFGGSSNNSSVRLSADQQNDTLNATVYQDMGNLLAGLGLHLIAGRNFRPDEYQDLQALIKSGGNFVIPGAIINQTMAERLFPGQNPIGKTFYSWGEQPIPVIGVVEELTRPNNQDDGNYSMIFPLRDYGAGLLYVMRTDPSRRSEVLKAGLAALKKHDPMLLVTESGTFANVRADHFKQDRTMAWMLVVVIIALLVVTALGIVGLVSFWVQQRTRQIGVRRALGATRAQVLHYFQAENFLLASIGIVIGMLLAYSINLWLMSRYELPRLPLIYLPVGALTLWLIGQLAVLWPARRAAAVPPAVATRSA